MLAQIKNPKLLGIFFALGFLLWMFNPFVSQEDRILKVLKRLENEYYLDKGENKIQYAARVAGLSEIFSKEVKASLMVKFRDQQVINGRQDLKTSMVTAGGRLTEFNIRFFDTQVNLTGADAANVGTSCEIQYQEDELYQARDMVFEFEKVDGDWLIKTIENSEPWEF